MEEGYLDRIVDAELEKRLKLSGAVHIKGPKWCGKTYTGTKFSKSVLEVTPPVRRMIVASLDTNSTSFLNGETPRLIDEWQEVPEIWDMVRFEVDHRHKPGQFILAGSTVPPSDSMSHSGVGRISTLRMRTMSLLESKESNGLVSLKGLFDGDKVDAMSELNFDSIVHAVVRGGWPEAVASEPLEDPGYYARDYYDTVVKEDMSRFLYKRVKARNESENGTESEDGREYDATVSKIFDRLLKSLSRNIGTTATQASILAEVNSDRYSISENTLKKYLVALEKMFITENLEAWNTHLRSKTRLTKSSKWFFVDPSVAAAALGYGEDQLKMDLNAFGFYFESMCLRDVRVYAEQNSGEVFYFQNTNGYEVDFIVELRDGRWGAFEVKLGMGEFDKAAENLLKLRDVIDTKKKGEPAFLAILTGVPIGYTRADGIHVVPIGCLGP